MLHQVVSWQEEREGERKRKTTGTGTASRKLCETRTYTSYLLRSSFRDEVLLYLHRQLMMLQQ